MLFFITGLNIKTATIVGAFLYYKLISLVQFISFVICPAMGLGLASILKVLKFNESLANGIVIACCCPTTVSSNVVLTIASNGNEAATLANSIIGNVLGIFVSPVLIIWLLGLGNSSGGVDYLKIFGNLGIIVVGPLFLGQIVRVIAPKRVEQSKKYLDLGLFNSILLLAIIYAVFCDTFASGAFSEIPGWLFVVMLVIMLVLLMIFSAISFYTSILPIWKFTKHDSISILFSASQKTVALGIPLIKVIFENSPYIGVLSIPILIYHAEQLIFGAILVPRLLKWCPKEIKDESGSELNEMDSQQALVIID